MRKTWKLSEMFSSLLVGQFLVPPAVRACLYRDSRNYFFFLDLTSTLNDDRWGWRGGGLGAWGSPVILFSFPFIIFFPQQCQITSWWKYIPITLSNPPASQGSSRSVCDMLSKKSLQRQSKKNKKRPLQQSSLLWVWNQCVVLGEIDTVIIFYNLFIKKTQFVIMEWLLLGEFFSPDRYHS